MTDVCTMDILQTFQNARFKKKLFQNTSTGYIGINTVSANHTK